MSTLSIVIIVGVVLGILLVVSILAAVLFRKVVSTNMVHIVQRSRKTTSYGTGQGSGNVYYKWPSWVPHFGVTVIQLPVSNFDLSLDNYEAYDKDRVPFKVDITAFFRVKDTTIAAQRVSSLRELKDQLSLIVQGAVRKVLAGDVIDSIMLERSKFGEAFTNEVADQLEEWGVESVKSMELMDIRDGDDSKVISNIMAKKTSQIEMESRVEVAGNKKKAETAEIEARQVVEIREQEAQQAVGERTAEKEKAVGIAQEKSRQEVLTEEEQTKERSMKVQRVEQVRSAEITKEEKVVSAQQEQETMVIKAEGQLEAEKRKAAGVEVVGKAEAEAVKAMKMAPVEAQIALAKEIGGNPGYQQYLATIEAVKAHIEVGGKQAEALKSADVKVIANTGEVIGGMNGVMDLFTSKGGTELAAAFEGLAQSPIGKSLIEKFAGTETEDLKTVEEVPEGSSEE